MKKYSHFLLASIAIFMFSCVKEHEPLIIKDKYFFTDIVKIFDKNGCSSCHSTITKKYSEVLKKWVDTTLSPEATKLYLSIKSGGSMNQYITDPDIDKILKWIQEGALEGEPIIDTTTPPPPNNTDSSYFAITIHPILKSSCIGCHHDNSEINYSTLYITNAQGFIWIADKNNTTSSLVYQKVTTGTMKDYLVEPEKTKVIQWLADGANKTKYAYNKDIKSMFVNNCATCHDFVGNYNSVISNWVDTTKVSSSTLLYSKISPTGSMNQYMPADSVVVVNEWIREGAAQ